jgi:hypothetical protein
LEPKPQGSVEREISPAATTNIAWKDDVTAAYGTESITQFPAVHVAGAAVSVPYDPRFDEFRYRNVRCFQVIVQWHPARKHLWQNHAR